MFIYRLLLVIERSVRFFLVSSRIEIHDIWSRKKSNSRKKVTHEKSNSRKVQPYSRLMLEKHMNAFFVRKAFRVAFFFLDRFRFLPQFVLNLLIIIMIHTIFLIVTKPLKIEQRIDINL